MQTCPQCDRVYDESESVGCPYRNDQNDCPTYHTIHDFKRGEALELPDDELEELRPSHPEYQ